MLRRFQIPYLQKEGYVNLRCAWVLGCPSEIKPLEQAGKHRENVHAGENFKIGFEALFPGKEVPETIGASCCAQFGVTREKILEKSKEEYEHYRDWILKTDLGDAISGRIMEYSWHGAYCSIFQLIIARTYACAKSELPFLISFVAFR
jgi:hypothetical protein